MTAPKRPETVEQYAAKAMSGRLDAIIKRFGDLARDLHLVQERINSGVKGDGTYAWLAAEVQYLITTAVYDMGVHGLTSDAEEADRARTARIVAEVIAEQIGATAADAARLIGEDAARVDGLREGASIALEYAAREG